MVGPVVELANLAETAANTDIDVSVIVPTLNESANLPLLVPQVAAALAGRTFEILIVDDNS